MGSFPVTCAVSGLAIDCEDPMRLFLLTQSPHTGIHPENEAMMIDDLWFVRTPPLACVYKDSAGVKGLPEGIEREVWLQGFQVDLIEGVVDERCFNSPTSKTMCFEDLLDALFDGLIWVEPEGGRMVVDRSRALQTERLRQLGVTLSQSTRPIEVDKAPSTMPKRLQVLPAFVREDVWQALLKMPHAGYDLLQIMARVEHMTGLMDAPPFQFGPCAHIELVREASQDQDVPQTLVRSTAELFYIQGVLARTGFQWRPTTRSHTSEIQWQLCARLHQTYAHIAREAHLRDDRRRRGMPDVS